MEGTELSPSTGMNSKLGMDDRSSMSPFNEGRPKSAVDELLRKKRKVREHKACYPCRQRKVRCDLARPCRTCVEREHPELCDYHPPAKRPNNGIAQSGIDPELGSQGSSGMQYHGPSVTIPQSDFQLLCRKLDNMEAQIADLRRDLRTSNSLRDRTPHISGRNSPSHSGNQHATWDDNPYTRHASLHGIHTKNDLTGQTVHLGGQSVPALVMALGQGKREQPSIQEILGRSILPIFGLDNETATYPFIDLWDLAHGSQAKAEQLAKTIPTDSQCLSFYHYYRDLGHVIYPGVADPAAFETELTNFLMRRASYIDVNNPSPREDQPMRGVSEQSFYDKDMHWVGLMFAVLASGCQCSSLTRKERELTSQVYVCCSFECLRFCNFLSHATLETVQTLLVLENVISNNMNAGTAWNLMGLTVRLAMSLGLHQACPGSMPKEIKTARSKIWWTLMWQDSLLSITYDRASSTALMDHSSEAVPYTSEELPHYHRSMYRVTKVGLDIVRDRSRIMSPRELFSRITRLRDEIQTIIAQSADYLRDSSKCRSFRDSVEHWALFLHSSYITSELCRPAISPSTSDRELTRHFRQLCLDSLVNTVEAYVGLQNITPYARHSWASVHRALSSALLLGIMGEHAHNERCRRLLGRFSALMSDMTTSLDQQEIAAPMARAISALRKLNIFDSTTTPSSQYPNIMHQPPTTQHHQSSSAAHHTPGYLHDDAHYTSNPGSRGHGSSLSMVATPSTDDSDHGLSYVKTESSRMFDGSAAWSTQRRTTVSDVGDGHSDGESPYAVVNSILWGNGKSP